MACGLPEVCGVLLSVPVHVARLWTSYDILGKMLNRNFTCWPAKKLCHVIQCVSILFDILDLFIHSIIHSFTPSCGQSGSLHSVAQPRSCVSNGTLSHSIDFPIGHPSPIAAVFLDTSALRCWVLLVSWLIMNHWNWKTLHNRYSANLQFHYHKSSPPIGDEGCV